MPDLSLNEYQKLARRTAVYPNTAGVAYPLAGLASETGEVLGKWAKYLRGDRQFNETKHMMLDEAGDVLWNLANLCSDLGVDLAEVAQRNVDKLADREARGVLKGDGDKR